MNKRILMVEDDPGNIKGTRLLLEQAGIVVDVVESIEAAERALRARAFDLLLVDWTLPATHDGPSDREAGGRLIASLKSGRLGEANLAAKYFIITKQADQFDGAPLEHKDRLGVLSKLDALAIVERVAEALGMGE